MGTPDEDHVGRALQALREANADFNDFEEFIRTHPEWIALDPPSKAAHEYPPYVEFLRKHPNF